MVNSSFEPVITMEHDKEEHLAGNRRPLCYDYICFYYIGINGMALIFLYFVFIIIPREYNIVGNFPFIFYRSFVTIRLDHLMRIARSVTLINERNLIHTYAI
uniref:Uncharacterized protein n=1 Tax=Heterorhabditis bacteriophora TaxID=37862 RepID=A0A1I7X952_HETBA